MKRDPTEYWLLMSFIICLTFISPLDIILETTGFIKGSGKPGAF